MPAVLVQRTRPPVGFPGVNPHWLRRGLQMVVYNGTVLFNREGSAFATRTVTGGPKTNPSKFGQVMGFGTTYGTGTTDRINSGKLAPPSTSKRSVVAQLYPKTTGGGAYGRVFQDASGSGLARGEGFWINSTTGISYTVYIANLGSAAQWQPAAPLTLDAWQVVGISVQHIPSVTTPCYAYIGGRFVASANSGGGSGSLPGTNPVCDLTFGNRASDGARVWDGMIGLVLIFDGFLTAAEHASLAANIHQIWAPEQRLLWQVAAAAPAAQPDRKVRQVPRTRQPLNYTELDANNPLTKGAYAWTPRVPFMWAGGRPVRRALSELNAVIGASGDGITRRWTSVAQSGIDFGVNPLITQSNGISALVIGAPATGTSRCIVSQRLTATPTVGLDLLYNDDGQGGGSSGSIALRTYAAGYKAVSATSQVDGTRHVWVLSNSAGTGFVLRDGVEQTLASNTRLSGTSAELTQQLRVGNFADFAPSGFQTSESISLVIVWDRALTVTEARKIAANPWQIFKPEERVVFAAGPPSPDVTVALSGVLGTLSLGAYTLTSAVPLTGVLGTGSVGALLPVSSFAATGVSGALSTGALLADTAVPLTGLASTISVGTLTAETGTVVALTGVSGTLSTGTLGVELSVPLAGVVGTSAAGTVGPVTALAATGVEGTLAVGSVLPAFSIPLTGEAITTSIGTMVVSGGTVTVALIGVSTTVSLGSLTALAVDGWTPIPTPQTPGWVAVSNTQTPLWTPIIDTQTPGWTPIIT